MGFIKPYKWYIATHSFRLQKIRRFFPFPKPKKRVNKKIICEIEPLTALPPQICQIVRVPMFNVWPSQRSEASTLSYLCVCLLVPVGLKLYRL